LTSAVVIGVVGGAVIGGAYAAVTGGDILKGALFGAVAGGLGGAASFAIANPAILAAEGVAPVASTPAMTGTTAATGAAANTAAAGTAALPNVTPALTAGSFTAVDPALALPAQAAVLPGATDAAAAAATAAANKSLLYSNIGLGLAKGVGDLALSGNNAGDRAAAVEAETNAARDRIAANQAGIFEAKTANIQTPNWWDKYLNTTNDTVDKYKTNLNKYGLLGGANGTA
jgi:hypothetical protein